MVSLAWPAAFDAGRWAVAYWPQTREQSRQMPMPNPSDLSAPMASEGQQARSSISASVSLEAEVPEVLFEGMRNFISRHPDWDQYSVITSALAGFLFQNGCSDHSVSQHYLDGLFLRQG